MANKILLVSLEGTSNFGNRLQHYALQHEIKSCGYTVDNLMVRTNVPVLRVKLKKNVKILLICCGMKKFINSLSTSKRQIRFLDFNNRYLSGCVRMHAQEVQRRNWDAYAFAVTGSDQVWHNWHFHDIPDDLSYYYLEFIDESKRVSYAPSFGFTSFPPEDIEQHRQGLLGMRALSCREQEGCELIRGLTGRKAQKVLDPTLLLTADEWSEIEKNPSFMLPDRYLLQFFLGDVTAEYRAEIKRIADERGLQILNINDKSDPEHYAIGPDEFVWLVHHADTICTDSFHASVFSITYERNLRVFHREQKGFKDMFGRLRDLLEPLGLRNLVYGEGDSLSTVLDEGAKEYLALERKASLQYLNESLKNA